MAFDCDLAGPSWQMRRPPWATLVQHFIVLDEGAFTMGPVAARSLRLPHPRSRSASLCGLTQTARIAFAVRATRPFPSYGLIGERRRVFLLHEPVCRQGNLKRSSPKYRHGRQACARNLANSHSTAEQAAQIATQAGVGHLVFYHIIPADDPAFGLADWQAAIAEHWDGPFTLAHDGLTVEF